MRKKEENMKKGETEREREGRGEGGEEEAGGEGGRGEGEAGITPAGRRTRQPAFLLGLVTRDHCP